jgi:16S rRNA (adenine1518-N6/adenine1519-N6)-dimethyltransferase
MAQIDDLPPLREVIRRHGLTPKKSLGQNFLFDLNLTARIARAAEPLENITVVEIGPGPGGLTRALLALGARRVVAIERDQRAIAALEEIGARYPGQLEIVAGDALRIDPRDQLGPERARVVANLPYNIATALLIGWLTAEPWPPWYDSLLLMFQREVAERIVATPGSKSYGRLSVLAAGAARLPIDCASARDRSCLWAASQDVAAKPENARRRCRSAALGSRHRTDRAGRGNSRRGFRGAGKYFQWAR